MKNNLLKKFGMEKEYLDWKTNLPVDPKVGDKFIVTGGVLKGKRGTITKEELSYFYINVDGAAYGDMTCERENFSKYLKLIK